jgi:hypothetical protein
MKLARPFPSQFDMAGYEQTSGELKSQWGMHDSREGFADRGTWMPKFSLKGGSLITGTGGCYDLGPTNPPHSAAPIPDLIGHYANGPKAISSRQTNKKRKKSP